MLYIHLDHDYDIEDVIKQYRNYYEELKVNNIISDFKNNYGNKKVKLDNISNPLTDL